jgi:hypothetical protein
MDRRSMLTFLGASPALLGGFPTGAAGAREIGLPPFPASEAGSQITVMNPAIAGKLATRVPLVPPLDSLDNKTIYFINLSWEGPDAANYFYGAMREWFDKNYKGVQTIVKVTAEGMFGSDPSVLKDITAKKADAAIVGVAG